MAAWHTTMMLTESNKGGEANDKGLVELRLAGWQYKLGQSKWTSGHAALNECTRRDKSLRWGKKQWHWQSATGSVGVANQIMCVPDEEWWCWNQWGSQPKQTMVVLGLTNALAKWNVVARQAKKCGSKTRHGYVTIGISAGLMRQYAFDLPSFERSFWISLILLHGNSHGGYQIFKTTDKEKRVCLLASGHSNSRFIPKQMNSHFSFCRVTALSSITSALYTDVQMKGINQHQTLS